MDANAHELDWANSGKSRIQIPSWIRHDMAQLFSFQDSLEQLGTRQRRVYDDGHLFVLDLKTSR